MFGWKRPEMVFIDERVHLSDDLSEATFRYTYPADHVFCAGHFPGNPIMMGIAQWIAVADAAAWLAFERVGAGIVPPPDGRRRADAEIVRETGGLVTEVRGLIFTAEVSADGGIGPVRIERTRRVGFRDLVRPGETVFVRIRLEPDGRG